jgi:hypothetical protein
VLVVCRRTGRHNLIMVISKFAFRIAALAAIIGAPIWQPVRAEETATQHTSDSATCPRSTFRVVIDVGHTATSPGADSARGVHEYEFNLDLAEAIVQSLREAQFDRTVRLITSGARLSSLFHRVASAKHLQADLFPRSITTRFPITSRKPGNMKERNIITATGSAAMPFFYPMTMQIAPAAWSSLTRSVKSCRSAVYITRRIIRFR